MKYILIITAVFVCSCSQSTENRIKSAVIDKETEQISKDEKIEDLNVDSIQYSEVSMKDYFSDRKIIFNNVLIQRNDITMDLIRSYIRNNNKKGLETIRKEALTSLNLEKTLDSLYSHADTVRNIYKVRYLLVAKTDKNSYKTNNTVYLKADDLTKEVKVDLGDYK